MNPAQSESYWKDLMRDDVERRCHPPDPLRPNPPRTRAATQRPRPLSLSLQQQPMKRVAFEWRPDHERQLFDLHRQLGNKWSSIAARLGADDNAVKNKFYSTLRRGLRRLNRYIETVRRRLAPTHLASNKYVKPELLVKVSAVADRTHDEKYEVKQPALDLAQDIQRSLIELAAAEADYDENHRAGFPFQEELLTKIQQFNRNCKRRKGKRKAGKQEDASSSDHDTPLDPVPPSVKSLEEKPEKLLAFRDQAFQVTTPAAVPLPSPLEAPATPLSFIKTEEAKGVVLGGTREQTEGLLAFSVNLQDSQNIFHNSQLIASTPKCLSQEGKAIKEFFAMSFGFSSTSLSTTFAPQSQDLDCGKFIYGIPNVSNKYNANMALIKSSDIRYELNRSAWAFGEKLEKEKQEEKEDGKVGSGEERRSE